MSRQFIEKIDLSLVPDIGITSRLFGVSFGRGDYPRPNLLIAGPTQGGKSSLVDQLVQMGYVEAPKLKNRRDGMRPEDGQRADSQIIDNEQASELEARISDPNSPIAYMYRSNDRYFVPKEGLNDESQRAVVVANVHLGAQGFMGYHEDAGLPYTSVLLLANPEDIKERLYGPDIPEGQRKSRLDLFNAFQEEFSQNVGRYSILFRQTIVDVVDIESQKRNVMKAIRSQNAIDAQKLHDITTLFQSHHQPGMSITETHISYLDTLTKKLFEKDLDQVRNQEGELEINRDRLLDAWEKYDQTTLSPKLREAVKDYIQQVQVVDVVDHYGRTSVLLSLSPDHKSIKPYFDDKSCEEVLVEVLYEALTPVTARRRHSSFGFDEHSKLGLFRINGASVKDGILMSLGDLYSGDAVHPGLHIGFIDHNPQLRLFENSDKAYEIRPASAERIDQYRKDRVPSAADFEPARQ